MWWCEVDIYTIHFTNQKIEIKTIHDEKKSNSKSKTVKRNNEDEIHTIVRGYIDKDKDVK